LLIASLGAKAEVADQVLLQACQSCHAIHKDDAQGIGPSLVKVIGRTAGSLQDFKYSQALSGIDFEWNVGTLRVWIKHTEAMVPGTFMRYQNNLNDHEVERLLILLTQISQQD
jgi:cytochrome c